MDSSPHTLKHDPWVCYKALDPHIDRNEERHTNQAICFNQGGHFRAKFYAQPIEQGQLNQGILGLQFLSPVIKNRGVAHIQRLEIVTQSHNHWHHKKPRSNLQRKPPPGPSPSFFLGRWIKQRKSIMERIIPKVDIFWLSDEQRKDSDLSAR